MAKLPLRDAVRAVRIEPEGLEGLIGLPVVAKGVVIFSHGSGSGRLSPRNQHVASVLQQAGLATLLLDLLKPEEERDRRNVFDIDLLASRLVIATRWVRRTADFADLPIGYFGASTGAGAALVAAARLGGDVSAVVSRGGRPDLAGNALKLVRAPTLLIVGGADGPVIGMNQSALHDLSCTKHLVIVPGAGHLFEEPGTLDDVAHHAQQWFTQFLARPARRSTDGDVFEDRRDAGRQLAERLMPYKNAHPIVLALPRGGVPVAFEVAKALESPLDVVFVRKIGAPHQPELGLGAVVDGADPQLVLNDELVRQVGPSSAYIEAQCKRELVEIERRRELYRPGRQPPDLRDRTVIVVDDGIATGGTVKAVLRAIVRAHPRRVVLAVPVAPRETIDELSTNADDIICLSTPGDFRAVGLHYRDFAQTTDGEVIRLLQQA
jgi:putative phosphoribosyl transferase